jgi:lysophospholipase L1-like esterase
MASWFRAARNASQRVPRWAVGVAVATPLAAVLQGGLMLHQYRRDHGHAPRPISPSQGLVVVSSNSNNNTAASNDTTTTSNDSKPLRLLVIGDSLAAGVGVSSSGTPILPQSIARALSSASNGRAVHWTCIGTPGASASQVVHDLGAYQDTPSLLERKHVEWQVATSKAKEWWEQRMALEEERKLQKADNENNKNRVKVWWSRVRQDVQQIKLVVLKEIPQEVALQSKLTRRKTSLDPDVQYDIAVVLTGINDLKDAFLPFMRMRKQNAPSTTESTSLKDALVNIIHALQSKMKLNLPKDDDTEEEDEPTVATSPTPANDDQQQLHRGPLVVFPGMPAAPLPLTHYPPLSWFLIPLIEMMDNNKRRLAQSFPGLVLYVDPPSAEDFRGYESGQGEVYASRHAEKVLLQLTNVTQRAQEKVKELMEQHYSRGNNSAASDNDSKENDEDERMVYGQGCRDHEFVEPQHTPGSTLISEDRVHPNDAGYDMWGRHIAAAIIREWKQEERSS